LTEFKAKGIFMLILYKVHVRMSRFFTLSLFFCVILSAPSFGKINTATANFIASKNYLLENNGQVTDQYGNKRNDIDFKLSTAQTSVFIGSGSLHYQWYMSENGSPETAIYRLDVSLEGCNKKAKLFKEVGTGDKETYYADATKEPINCNGWSKITYKNIYPLIDWVIYTNRNGIKYDFLVHPGGNPSNIKLSYSGHTSLKLNGSGDLIVSTPLGSITEGKPYSYTVRNKDVPVTSAYTVNNNTVSFNIGPFYGTLIIDPVVDWISYYGGTGTDDGNAIASDDKGNVYLAGTTNSTSNIATTGAHQISFQGQTDIFIAAFNIHGNRKWATYFGGAGTDECYDAACDTFGNIYICGRTTSTSGLATNLAHQFTHGGGGFDGFLCRFSNEGKLDWGTYYGGAGADAINNINCDALGSLFLCGSTGSSSNIAYINAYQLNLSGGSDGFIARFNSSGQRQWSTYYGGPSNDDLNFTSPDRFGNVYAYGTTSSATGIAVGGVHQTTINTSSPTTFLTKFDLVGNAVWSTYFGGTDGARAGGIATDPSGSIYICGSTISTTGIATIPSFQQTKNLGEDGFLSKFSAGGTQLWGTYFGNTGQDNLTGIVINSKFQLYTSATTNSNTGMTTPDALQLSLNGIRDALYARWDVNGNLVYSSYCGGNGSESTSQPGIGSFIDYNAGKAYICGSTTSTSGLATTNAHSQVNNGGTEAFAAGFFFDTMAYILPFYDTILCEGSVFNLPYKVPIPFGPGNIFTVQLSDGKGSFASPAVIGSITSSTGGTILCQVPLGTPADTGYRVRIVSNIPNTISIDNSIDIRIDNIPQAPIVFNGSPACIGDTLKLYVQSPVQDVMYFWNGPGFSGYAAAVTFNKATPAIEGIYTITPTLFACTGPDAQIHVTVKPTPEVILSGSNSPVCELVNVQLTAQADSIASTYNWKGPNGFISTNQNPAVPNPTVVDNGLYEVTATLNGCTSKPDSIYVVIKRNPVLNSSTNSPVCEGDTLILNTSDIDGQTIYNWTGPANFTASGKAHKIVSNFSNAGTYYISATNNGCTDTDTLNVLVKPKPFPAATNNSPICSGELLTLSVTSAHPGTNYNWYGPDDFNSTDPNPAIKHTNITARGTYRIIANLDGCVQEDTTTVIVNQAPSVVLSSNSPVYRTQQLDIIASNNLSGASYQWTGPAGFSSNNQNLLFAESVLQNSGLYVLKTNYMGCSSTDSIEVLVYDIVEGQFILFPNPNNGTFTIRAVNTSGNELDFGVWDAAGRVIYTGKVKGRNYLIDEQITLPALASGVYILRVRFEGGNIERRFTVVR
jgi:hypothetical protein